MVAILVLFVAKAFYHVLRIYLPAQNVDFFLELLELISSLYLVGWYDFDGIFIFEHINSEVNRAKVALS